MRLAEKKFICDIASIILALGTLICTLLLFLNYELFHRLTPLIFGFGSMMFLAMFFRNRMTKSRGRMIMHLLLSGVLVIFTALAVLFPGGAG